MIAGTILRAAFSLSNQQLRFIFLDCVWRILWLALSFAFVMMLGAGLLSEFSSLQWEGPDLGASNPIIVLAALKQFWNSYGAFLLTSFGLMLLMLVVLWLVLEALFRGGWKAFWIYLGTGAARTTLLFCTAGIFLLLLTQDRSAGTLLIGTVAVSGMSFVVGLLETVVRRDAVDLLATDLMPLAAVVGCLRLAEGVIAFILFGSAAVVLLRSTAPVLAGLFAGVVFLFWMIVHSYLVALRYSAIDIMRRNVVRS